MRFSVPWSPSSSQARRSSRSTFRAPASSDDEGLSSDEDDLSDYDLDISVDSISKSEDDTSDSGESLCNARPPLKMSARRSPEERKSVYETLAAIRVRSKYKDPYEEWERWTRMDAFYTARRQQLSRLSTLRKDQHEKHVNQQKALDAARTKEVELLTQRIGAIQLQTQADEQRLRESWKQREQKLWERIEKAIKEEEDKVHMKLEAERKLKEEEDRKRKEEEDQKRRVEEAKRAKEAEEKLKKEREEARKAEQRERKRLEEAQNQQTAEMRYSLGLVDSEELWKMGLQSLRHLKNVTMRLVKGPKPPDPMPEGYQAPPAPPLKKIWSAQRRKITPKVGQLTDDPGEIARITEELRVIIAPIPNMPEQDRLHLHAALLSSLAKAMIAQAETEVTANKAQAAPLARVAIGLMGIYPLLGEIFWAKLCEFIGCWAAGVEAIPLDDEDSDALPEKERLKRCGSRPEESVDDQTTRISGVLRLYFSMLSAAVDLPSPQPLPVPFRPARYWLYLSQLLNNEIVLSNSIAAEAIYVALDETGSKAKSIWGKQFIKMLQVIYEGVQGDGKEMFGGSDVLAQASRARCQLEVEKIMSGQ